MFNTSKSILQQLHDPKGLFRGVRIFVKRDDLIDELVSGNKWRKLKFNLEEAKRRKNLAVLTFGGAYSNHLVATAKAGNLAGIATIGIVRGDELTPESNSTLQQCHEFGMQLVFVSREEYGMRNDKQYLDELHGEYENVYIVPEGGANFYGMMGCQEIWKELGEFVPDEVVVAAGTGTTTAGLLMGAPEHTKILAVSSLKGDFMTGEIRHKLMYSFFDEDLVDERMTSLRILDDSIFGGYGKTTPELLEFISFIEEEYLLPLDKVYTAKAFYQLMKEIEKGTYTPGMQILFVHTGGLQGN